MFRIKKKDVTCAEEYSEKQSRKFVQKFVLEYYGMLGFGVEPIRMKILYVYIEI